jgi:hypothetical protein
MHGLEAVLHEVEHDLLHLVLVCVKVHRTRGIFQPDTDVAVLEAELHETDEAPDDIHDIDVFADRLAAVGEQEELADDGRDELDLLLHVLDPRPQLGLGETELHGGQVIDDDPQGIVDLVRHPGCQEAHRGELLGEHELGPQALLLGLVLDDDHVANGVGAVADGIDDQVDNELAAPQPQGRAVDALLAPRGEEPVDLPQRVLVALLEQGLQGSVQVLLAVEAEELARREVDHLHQAVAIHDEEHDREELKDGLVEPQVLVELVAEVLELFLLRDLGVAELDQVHLVDVVDRAREQDLPVLHDAHRVGEGVHVVDLVGDEHHGHALLLPPPEEGQEPVQVRRGDPLEDLVEDQELRLLEEALQDVDEELVRA